MCSNENNNKKRQNEINNKQSLLYVNRKVWHRNI